MIRKKAIVTGGSHGIGKGIVLELASKGYDVAFSYNKREAAALAFAKELQEKFEINCGCFQADFQNKKQAEIFFGNAAEYLGGADVLVNNAGVTWFENLLDITEEKMDLLLNLDFKNYIWMMQICASYMKEHKICGCIINITSTRGERAYPGDGIYGACKAGLNRAVQSFALELAPYGIRINNVAPGSVEVRTEGEEEYQSMKEIYQQLGKKIPLGRMGRPEDIGKAAAFLASENASYITGITLRVDGGLILPGMPERVKGEK
ncbi:MAG: SDR family oxidoreductase [Eubacteriales bacterium]|nr:SDR family oxidoreductase [Eubacteriales bacterium]